MIIVVGARGMLGRDLLAVFGGEARGVSHQEMEITDPLRFRHCWPRETRVGYQCIA